MKFHSYTRVNSFFLFLCALIFWGCPDSASTTDTDSPLGEPQFTFLQNDQILYFAIDVESRVNGSPLQTVAVHWFGTAGPDSTADYLLLNDVGISGDILENDYLYSLKVINNTLTHNPIDDDTGRVYLDFEATYENNPPFIVQDSFYLGNIIPIIGPISAPDTIFLPDSGGVTFELVKARVHDANGLDDIRRVGFVSFYVDDSTFLNEGNIINLYDDGSEVIIYEPNFTSGDEVADDGEYSFEVLVFGPGNPNPALKTKTGTFNWIFEAMDMANTYSDTVFHRIIVQ